MKPESFICETIREQIDGLSRKGLQAAGDSGPIQEHVQQCASCREYFEKTMALARHLDSWQIPEPNEDLCARVMTEIAQMERERRSSLLTLLKQGTALLKVRLRVPAAAAVLLMAALVISITLNIREIYQTAPALQAGSPSDNLTIVLTSDDTLTTLSLDTDLPDQIRPYVNSATLAPSTFVVVLGAPPTYPDNRLGEILSTAVLSIAPSDGKPSTDTGPRHVSEPEVNL